MKRFILIIGATVALVISSVGSVAADDPDPVAACPDGTVLAHEPLTVPAGGGGGEIVKELIRVVDRNGDGHVCIREVIFKGVHPAPPIDNNVPFRELVVKPH